VRDYIALVTDGDDVEHWWDDGWGKTEVLRGTAVPVPFTDSRSEKACVKELNTKHVQYAVVQYKEMQAINGMHSGDRDDSSISCVWQRFVCLWSSCLKKKLPAK
jgi:hypothetical protein